MKRFLVAAALAMLPVAAFAQVYTSPTYQNVTVLGTLTANAAAYPGVLSAATGSAGNINGRTAGYPPFGFTFGWGALNGADSDLLYNQSGGLNFYAIDSSGNIHGPEFKLDGSGNLTAIGELIGSSGAKITASTGGDPVPVGDNVATIYAQGNRLDVEKQLLTAVTNTPTAFFDLQNTSPMPLAGYGLYPQIGTLASVAYGLTGGTASLDASIFTENLYGNSPYQAQDVGVQCTVNQYGHDSSWCIDTNMIDYSGEPPNDFSQVSLEQDMAGNGPDATTSQYDPLHTYRVALTINPGTATWGAWVASTVYHPNGTNTVGSIIQMNNPAAVLSIYKVTACTGNCTSGTSQPTFPASGNVTETTGSGSVTWTYEQAAAYQVGRGIWVNGYGTDGAYFGSGFATDAAFSDAAIDTSEASLRTDINANAAGIRLGAGQPIDFSGNGTAAGQNLHTLEWTNAFGGALYYNKQVSGTSTNIFLAADNGIVSVPGVLRSGYGSLGSLLGITSGYVAGITMGVDYAGYGEADIMGTNGGFKFYATSGGVPSTNPIFQFDQNGNAIIPGTATITGQASFAGFTETNSADAGLNVNTANGLGFSLSVINASSNFSAYPMAVTFINQNPTFNGPYQNDYQQYGPIAMQGISAPPATGNTSAAVLNMRSYGMNPSGSYDVSESIGCNKYGQNSNWCLAADLIDFTGRPVQAFGNWDQEWDVTANGGDPVPWDASFAMPHDGGRIGALFNFSNLDLSAASIANGGWAWAAATPIKAMGVNATDYWGAAVIKVYVDSIPYLWYCVTAGTTGSTAPTFPIPSEFAATVAAGVMNVTSVQAGTPPLAVGAWVTAQGFIKPEQIASLGTGTGGTGTYNLSDTSLTIASSTGMYAAPHVTDGSAVWAFGENFQEYVSAGIWFGGTGVVNTEIGGQNIITNAFIDTTQNTFQTGAAALRVAANQIAVDLSGNGTTAGQNQRILAYSTYEGTNGFVYQSASRPGQATAFNFNDSGIDNLYGEVVLGNSATANCDGITSGYSLGGLTVCHNLDVLGEQDIITGNHGVYFYQTDNSGNITLPYANMGNSEVILYEQTQIEGNLSLTNAGQMTAALSTPASSSAACTVGTRTADASYIYVCVAANTWKRAALSSF